MSKNNYFKQKIKESRKKECALNDSKHVKLYRVSEQINGCPETVWCDLWGGWEEGNTKGHKESFLHDGYAH